MTVHLNDIKTFSSQLFFNGYHQMENIAQKFSYDYFLNADVTMKMSLLNPKLPTVNRTVPYGLIYHYGHFEVLQNDKELNQIIL